MRAQKCLTLCDSMDCSPPGSSLHGIFQAEYRSGMPFLISWDLPDPGIEPPHLTSPALAGSFLTTVPPGKPPTMSNKLSPNHPRPPFLDLLHNLRPSAKWRCGNSCFFKKKKSLRTETAKGTDLEASTLLSIFFPPHFSLRSSVDMWRFHPVSVFSVPWLLNTNTSPPALFTWFICTAPEISISKHPTLTPRTQLGSSLQACLQGGPVLRGLCFVSPTVFHLLWVSKPLISSPLSSEAIALHYAPCLANISPCVMWAWQNTTLQLCSSTSGWMMLGGNWKGLVGLSWHLWPQVSNGPPTLLTNAA